MWGAIPVGGRLRLTAAGPFGGEWEQNRIGYGRAKDVGSSLSSIHRVVTC